MKKMSKKAVFGIGAGLVAAAIGASLLCKKKSKEDEYIVVETDYDDEDVESE